MEGWDEQKVLKPYPEECFKRNHDKGIKRCSYILNSSSYLWPATPYVAHYSQISFSPLPTIPVILEYQRWEGKFDKQTSSDLLTLLTSLWLRQPQWAGEQVKIVAASHLWWWCNGGDQESSTEVESKLMIRGFPGVEGTSWQLSLLSLSLLLILFIIVLNSWCGRDFLATITAYFIYFMDKKQKDWLINWTRWRPELRAAIPWWAPQPRWRGRSRPRSRRVLRGRCSDWTLLRRELLRIWGFRGHFLGVECW